MGLASIVLPANSWRKENSASQVVRASRNIERSSGTWLNSRLFIELGKGLSTPSSCSAALMSNSRCSAYIPSHSLLLWDLHRTDSNDFLLDALRIYCVLQRERRQSRKFEAFTGEGFVAFGYKILMSFLLLFSFPLYNRITHKHNEGWTCAPLLAKDLSSSGFKFRNLNWLSFLSLHKCKISGAKMELKRNFSGEGLLLNCSVWKLYFMASSEILGEKAFCTERYWAYFIVQERFQMRTFCVVFHFLKGGLRLYHLSKHIYSLPTQLQAHCSGIFLRVKGSTTGEVLFWFVL